MEMRSGGTTRPPIPRRQSAIAKDDPEPRWLAIVAVLATGGLYLALPSGLTVGPRWAFPAVVATMLVVTALTHRLGHHRLDRMLGLSLISVVTIQMVWSLVLLIVALPSHSESPNALLVSAASLWTTNVLVFALWYWRLDAGGPHKRDQRPTHISGSFLFPQMGLSPEARMAIGADRWSPNFIDYLYLAFNTSTAFSATDTAMLSRWAKVLTMIQAAISLAVLALLAARAVNML
jgi:hypothetical protein